MRLLSLAVLILMLFATGTHAGIMRIDFEGTLASAEEGFPVPLAENETIQGYYLLDAGLYAKFTGGIIGDMTVSPLLSFSMLSSSGLELVANNLGIVQVSGEIIPGGLNRSSLINKNNYRYVVSVGEVVWPGLNLGDLFKPFTDFGRSQPKGYDSDDLHEFFVDFPYVLSPAVSMNFEGESNELFAEYGHSTLPPTLNRLGIATLGLYLNDQFQRRRLATFDITRLTVVPEPVTSALMLLGTSFATLGRGRRRRGLLRVISA